MFAMRVSWFVDLCSWVVGAHGFSFAGPGRNTTGNQWSFLNPPFGGTRLTIGSFINAPSARMVRTCPCRCCPGRAERKDARLLNTGCKPVVGLAGIRVVFRRLARWKEEGGIKQPPVSMWTRSKATEDRRSRFSCVVLIGSIVVAFNACCAPLISPPSYRFHRRCQEEKQEICNYFLACKNPPGKESKPGGRAGRRGGALAARFKSRLATAPGS